MQFLRVSSVCDPALKPTQPRALVSICLRESAWASPFLFALLAFLLGANHSFSPAKPQKQTPSVCFFPLPSWAAPPFPRCPIPHTRPACLPPSTSTLVLLAMLRCGSCLSVWRHRLKARARRTMAMWISSSLLSGASSFLAPQITPPRGPHATSWKPSGVFSVHSMPSFNPLAHRQT